MIGHIGLEHPAKWFGSKNGSMKQFISNLPMELVIGLDITGL